MKNLKSIGFNNTLIQKIFMVSNKNLGTSRILNFMQHRYHSISIYGISPRSDQQNIQSYLRSIFGINRARAVHICAKFKLNPTIRVGQISDEKLYQIKLYVENLSGYLVATDLKRALTKRLVYNLKQGSFKAKRFLWGLPVNGQSARANGKTAKRLLRLSVPKGLTPFRAVTSIDVKKSKKR
jgi:small subunit ribosomal protein S13